MTFYWEEETKFRVAACWVQGRIRFVQTDLGYYPKTGVGLLLQML